ETDSPVEPFFAGAAPSVSLSSLAEGLDHPLERPIEEREPGSFFDRLTRGRNWHTPRQKRNVKGFAKLERLLMDELTDLRVFRTGTVRITIYVVGLDAENNLSGIRTEAVET